MSDQKTKIMKLAGDGDFTSAKKLCLSVCRSQPGNAEMWFMLSAICGQLNDFKSAEKYCTRVIELNPAVPAVHYNLAIALRRQGKLNQAMESLKRALDLQSEFIPAIYELANVYMELEDYSRAIELYNRLTGTVPDAFQALTALGAAYTRSGQPEAAAEAFNKSLNINPSQPDALLGMAVLQEQAGNVYAAIESIHKAISCGYDQESVHLDLARLYAMSGDFSQAESQYQLLLSSNPGNKRALVGLALLYEQMFRFLPALDLMEKAATIGKKDALFFYNHGKILASANKLVDAQAAYERAIELKPGFTEAMINLGNIYLLCGKPGKAYKMYSAAYQSSPDNQQASSNMLMSLNYLSDKTESEIIEIHKHWAQKLDNVAVDFDISKKKTNKKPRIAYISPDFRRHSVSYFFDALLRHSTDRFENYCYSDVKYKDDVTKSLENMADSWLDVSLMSDAQLYERINADNIDILVDLAGHMAGNRMKMFAMKPAPIQITYLGYPHTTGLDVIDYRLVDHFTDPVESCADIVERRLYLDPSFICYRPIEGCPDVSPLPAASNGYVTFGSFNNLAKMSDEVVLLWSRILKKNPGSRLCIKAKQYADLTILNEHIEKFGSHGVERDRLEFITFSNTIVEHLGCYSKVDIALDTFPYNGTTTSCEALWMGVPVVGLSGNTHASRVGLSILNNINKSDWVADSQDAYLDIACELASNIERLEITRKSMRDCVSQSPLMQSVEFVECYENLLISALESSLDISKNAP